MNRQAARAVARTLGVAFLLMAAVQIVSLGLFLALHDQAYAIHSRLFTLTPEQFDLAVYSLLGGLKILGIGLFLVPWAALKLTLKGYPE